MQTEAFYGAAYLVVAGLYLAAAYGAWRSLREGARRLPGWVVGALPLAVLGHGVLLAGDIFGGGGLRFGFAQALSAMMFVASVFLWVEDFFLPLGGLYTLLLPLAAACSLLPLGFPGEEIGEGSSVALRVHISVSILAYSLFTIAALHGVLMNIVARRLHRPRRESSRSVDTLITQLPPLLSLESLIFRQIAAGFVLLTTSLGSGIFFSEELFGRPIRVDHKTVFSITAWFVFATLLAGRYGFGWRGKVAQRWMFTGFALLLLAYVGSRFVFEVILDRGWQ